MRRRDFITLIGGAAAWPIAGRAQPTMRVIGFLGLGSSSGYDTRLDGFRSGLKETGYVEGQNLAIEFRWASDVARLTELAAELVKQQLAVIFCSGNAATRAMKVAGSHIPIVFTVADDPVKLGYVSSFNRPGGNMTGFCLISGELGPKRLELVRDLIPGAKIIAFLTNPNNPAEAAGRREQENARALWQQVIALRASTLAEIEQAFDEVVQQKVNVLLVNPDAFFTAERDLIVRLATRNRVPTIYAWREFADAGGLMSYGTNLRQGYHQMGTYVGRLLNGEKPADLPVMQPTAFELIINLKAAKTLGITVPQNLLVAADEVIE